MGRSIRHFTCLKAVVALEGIETDVAPGACPALGGLKAVVALEGIETFARINDWYGVTCLKAVVALEGIETHLSVDPTQENDKVAPLLAAVA